MVPEQVAGLGSLLWLLKDLGAIGGLGYLVYLLLSGKVVTAKHLEDVVKAVSQNHEREMERAEAREQEWKHVAMRGGDIIKPLAATVREQLQAGRESS